MRKFGVEEWLIRVVMSMYDNARSKVRVSNTYYINVLVGVHQGSVSDRFSEKEVKIDL